MTRLDEGYTLKEMQQILVQDVKHTREVLEKIEEHLRILNSKVAKHQEVLFAEETGIARIVHSLERDKWKVVGMSIVITTALVYAAQILISHYF